MNNPLVLGIDIGTQGARVVIADTTGRMLADSYQEFARTAIAGLPPGYLEQNPDDWWIAVQMCLRQAILELLKQGCTPNEIIVGAVDSKSGTVVLLDDENHPLRPALMYDDRRAQTEADEVSGKGAALQKKLGYRFDPSFALPKILWLVRHEPEIWIKTRCVVHAADYIVGKITDVFGVTDQNTALKTGFDLIDFMWPTFIESNLGIDEHRLPIVIRSGETIGHITKRCAKETGLDETTRIVAGMSGDSADQIASGARHIGDWNTLLGTPIIFKGLTKQLLVDPQGRVYCHPHPMGYWMPSGVSKMSARVLEKSFPNANKGEFSSASLSLAPTSLLVYPLTEKGEKYLLDNLDVESFIEGHPQSEQELYAAHLEGLAYVERFNYGVLRSLGAEIRERIYTTGDGAKNLEWMQIRADVIGMECAHAANAIAAMGSAIIAASRTLFENIEEASAQMIQLDYVISPRPEMVLRYTDSYPNFLDACRRHGFVNDLRQSPTGIFTDLDHLSQ